MREEKCLIIEPHEMRYSANRITEKKTENNFLTAEFLSLRLIMIEYHVGPSLPIRLE